MRHVNPKRLWKGYKTAILLVFLGFMCTCVLLNLQQNAETGDSFSDYDLRFEDKFVGSHFQQQLDVDDAQWKHKSLLKIDRRPQAHFGGDNNEKDWYSNDHLREEHDSDLEGNAFRDAGKPIISNKVGKNNLTFTSMHISKQLQNDPDKFAHYGDNGENINNDLKYPTYKESNEDEEQDDEDDDDGDYEEEDFDDEYNEKLLENPNLFQSQQSNRNQESKTMGKPLPPTPQLSEISKGKNNIPVSLSMNNLNQRPEDFSNSDKQHFADANGPFARTKLRKKQFEISSPFPHFKSVIKSTQFPVKVFSQHLSEVRKHQHFKDQHESVQSPQIKKLGVRGNRSVIQISFKREKDTTYTQSNFQVVQDKIYWSSAIEKMVPKGNTKVEMMKYLEVRKSEVLEVSKPSWNKCGRLPNQYVVFSNGMAACARYRDPHNKLVLGEVLSYYLAQLLGLDNVPIVVLSQINSSVPQWQHQQHEIQQAHWNNGKIVAFVQWIDSLNGERSRVKMPLSLLEALSNHEVVDRNSPSLHDLSAGGLVHLLQWGEMTIFDYITGNYDRFASMQDGADKEKRPSIMQEIVRNLRIVPKTNKYWLIDNESGLFDAYDLMYRGSKTDQRFLQFHQQTLKLLCIFRRKVVENIFNLLKNPNPEQTLLQYAISHEPLLKKLSLTLSAKDHHIFLNKFKERVKEVATWIHHCRKQ